MTLFSGSTSVGPVENTLTFVRLAGVAAASALLVPWPKVSSIVQKSVFGISA